MKLTCPSCGAIASAEAWQNDAIARQVMAEITKLPAPVLPYILSYLTLYRPGKSALSWKKALRLVNEISALVATKHVQIQGKVARPCPARIWALAMEQMVERRDTLQLPIKGHNYLKKIAWGLADQEDLKREQIQRTVEATHTRPVQEDNYHQGNNRYLENAGLQLFEGELLLPIEIEERKRKRSKGTDERS